MRHPIGERAAAAFHLAFVMAYALALGFHAASALAHWRDRKTATECADYP